jgi:hypothetical protein
MSGATNFNPFDKSDIDPKNPWRNFSSRISSSGSFTESPSDFYAELHEEHETYYDPFSELNLFIAQKIQQEIKRSFGTKKWSLKIQEALIQKIAPEFKQKFPQFRLRIGLLKKIWEKIHYYSQQLQDKKEAFTHDGKLNIRFFIRENLKHYGSSTAINHVHPYHWAHKTALKICEYLAILEGVRPKIEEYAQLIWGMQKHLMAHSPEGPKNPVEDYDDVDKLIVKIMFQITAAEPLISQEKLAADIQKELRVHFEARIEEEIVFTYVENPELEFKNIVNTTLTFFKKTEQLSCMYSLEQTEKKVALWTHQNDMALRFIGLDTETPLFKLICAQWKTRNALSDIERFTQEIAEMYLQKFPQLAVYQPQLKRRILILCKYAYYTLFSTSMTSYEAFLKWHEAHGSQLEEISSRLVPLFPFEQEKRT